MRIELTPDEESLFELILGADDWAGLGQTYRVAGGWVRDKLLGRGTVDIDFALDRMTGRAFLATLRAYVDAHRERGVGVRGERVPRRGLGRGYLVGQNAEKSKHLETAGVRLFGISAEFVHLRSETYADGSRVPTAEFGTPESDALRRDLTVNALFYRLDTGEVEDFAGGLGDLAAMRLRTPMDPLRTFVDDPLRVLRVLRFYSRFAGSSIDGAALTAMGREEVRGAYERKLAPERAATEVLKLFAGVQPHAALREMTRAGLGGLVFGDAAIDTAGDAASALVEDVLRARTLDGVSATDRSLWLLGAWLWVCFGGMDATDAGRRLERALKPIGVGKHERGLARAVTRGVVAIFAERFDELAQGRVFVETREPGLERSDVWRASVAIARSLSRVGGVGDGVDLDERARLLEAYERAGVPAEPLLDGGVIMRLFPELNVRTGFIRDVHARLVDEQLARRVVSSADAEAFVQGIAASVRDRFGAGPNPGGRSG